MVFRNLNVTTAVVTKGFAKRDVNVQCNRFGFAAETSSDFEQRGQEKLSSKGVDILYVTDVSGGKTFGEEVTSGALLSHDGVIARYDRADKFSVARDLVSAIARKFEERNG